MIRPRQIKESKTSKMKLPVTSVNGLQPLINVTKNRAKDVLYICQYLPEYVISAFIN